MVSKPLLWALNLLLLNYVKSHIMYELLESSTSQMTYIEYHLLLKHINLLLILCCTSQKRCSRSLQSIALRVTPAILWLWACESFPLSSLSWNPDVYHLTPACSFSFVLPSSILQGHHYLYQLYQTPMVYSAFGRFPILSESRLQCTTNCS